ncbi:MAG: SEC-C metal-binding domain-containing protein [Pseudomonadota bacterium]
MAKISRNAPCPCGSGKKYKKCCLLHKEAEALEQRKILEQNPGKALIEIDDLDDLSNSVIDLIDAKKFDEAKSVCKELRERYPDQVDGIERMAMVYEACGENQKAAEYYQKTAEFMRSNPGFDNEGIQWALNKSNQLK